VPCLGSGYEQPVHDERSSRPDESDPQQRHEETLNRELGEQTAELRVILPGVTVLFAFLLTVPFAAGFAGLTTVQQNGYFTAFLAAALAIVLLLGEPAYHRLRGKPYDKGLLMKTANRQIVTALVLLGIALGAVVFVVTDVVFGRVASLSVTALVLLLAAVTWFGLPLLRRARGQ
jgi:hypothetical protein